MFRMQPSPYAENLISLIDNLYITLVRAIPLTWLPLPEM